MSDHIPEGATIVPDDVPYWYALCGCKLPDRLKAEDEWRAYPRSDTAPIRMSFGPHDVVARGESMVRPGFRGLEGALVVGVGQGEASHVIRCDACRKTITIETKPGELITRAICAECMAESGPYVFFAVGERCYCDACRERR